MQALIAKHGAIFYHLPMGAFGGNTEIPGCKKNLCPFNPLGMSHYIERKLATPKEAYNAHLDSAFSILLSV